MTNGFSWDDEPWPTALMRQKSQVVIKENWSNKKNFVISRLKYNI